jgi:hypothetical protein
MVPGDGSSQSLGGAGARSRAQAVSQPAGVVGAQPTGTVGGAPAGAMHLIDVRQHPVVPWAAPLRQSLLSQGHWHDPVLADRFVDVLSRRLCGTTVQAYGSKLNKFVEFCQGLRAQVVPASAELVYQYLAHLSVEGRVHPRHWAQYVAVINSMHRDLGLPTPWMETGFCRAFTHSAEKPLSESATVRPVRSPLLAEHVCRFVRCALGSVDVQVVRAAVAVSLAFLTFVRGASVMQLAVADVVCGPGAGAEVRVWDEKTRKGSGVARPVPVDWAAWPQLGELLRYWQRLREQVWVSAPGHRRGFLQLPGEPFPLQEGILDACMSVCVRAAGFSPAQAEGLHGHSCRSGGVSALHALGGSVLVAAARGGWRSLGTVFQHYLVLDVVPTVEVFLLLGFLLPPGVREVVRAQFGL